MSQELKTIRITAQMITNLELTLNVPADMGDEEIYERYRLNGEIDGGDLTEPEGDPGDWEWSGDFEHIEFDPTAPAYFLKG